MAELDDKGRVKIISGIDAVVSILIIIVGVVVLIFWLGLSDTVSLTMKYYSNYGSTNPYAWIEMTPWISLFAGIIAIIYGIDRLINNILNFIITKNP